MRRTHAALIVAVVVSAFLVTSRGARAQPSPTPAPDALSIAQRFWDAVNRKDVAGALALFADGGSYRGSPPCYQVSCTKPTEIAGRIDGDWVFYVPLSIDLEQTSPTTVIYRGQGFANRQNDTYSSATLQIVDGRISAFAINDLTILGAWQPCSTAPRPGICQPSAARPAVMEPAGAVTIAGPAPTSPSDPRAVVRVFFEAVNKGDGAAALALFADAAEYTTPSGYVCAQGCHSRSDVEGRLRETWLPQIPQVVVLERDTQGAVIARGQGALNRGQVTYFQTTIVVRDGVIVQVHDDAYFTWCGLAPPGVCPGFVPPPPIPAYPTITTASTAATVAAPVPDPARDVGPNPARSAAVPGGIALVSLAALGAAPAALIIAAAGMLVRRALRRRPTA